MNFQQAIDFLYAQLPMFSRDGASAYKKDLSNTIALSKLFDNPHKKLKTIHIAGTNGKGSSSHMLAAVLQQAGYKTGLYTSPHLYDFRERIKINGALCTEAFVINFVEKIKPFLAEIRPSFFEITVVMAFEYFVENNVDIAVIETGLGGRLDSTNVILPELSLITNIGMDHMDLLGDTLPKIALEKAGIIKPSTPVVISEFSAETRPVFEQKAKQEQSAIYFASEYYKIVEYNYSTTQLGLTIQENETNTLIKLHLDLPGLYQSKNILGVLQTIAILQSCGWKIAKEDIINALSSVKTLTGLHGRWEILKDKPLIIADVGHNVDGIKQINHQLKSSTYSHLHIVLGFVKDKDINASLNQLPKDATYYFTKAQTPRALNEELLKEKAVTYQLNGSTFPNIKEALDLAKKNYQDGDLILVCGSVFLVAEAKL